MNDLRDEIAELLRYKHSHTLLQIDPARAGIDSYYPLADAILDIEVERDYTKYGCDCPICNDTGKIKVKLRDIIL